MFISLNVRVLKTLPDHLLDFFLFYGRGFPPLYCPKDGTDYLGRSRGVHVDDADQRTSTKIIHETYM